MMSIKSDVSLLIFFTGDLSMGESGVMKSPIINGLVLISLS